MSRGQGYLTFGLSLSGREEQVTSNRKKADFWGEAWEGSGPRTAPTCVSHVTRLAGLKGSTVYALHNHSGRRSQQSSLTGETRTFITITGSSGEGAVWGILNSQVSAKCGSNSDSVGVLGGLNELLLRNAWHMTAWRGHNMGSLPSTPSQPLWHEEEHPPALLRAWTSAHRPRGGNFLFWPPLTPTSEAGLG